MMDPPPNVDASPPPAPQHQKPPISNVIVLLCAAAASLATLASGEPSGNSRAGADWNGDRQRIRVTIEPVEDRLAPFAHTGPIFLDLEVGNVLERLADAVRWSVRIDAGEGEGEGEGEGATTFSREGGFRFGEYNGQEDDAGLYGDVAARVGPLCTSADASDADCIPCPLDTGCVLAVDVDLCHRRSGERMDVSVILASEDGGAFHIGCPEDGDTRPCERLDGWLRVDNGPLDPGLCEDGTDPSDGGTDSAG